MKRDMDLVRKIVFALEEHEHGYAPALQIEGYTAEQIAHHVYLMMQEKLVEGIDCTDGRDASPVAQATSLTWLGHDFATAAQNDTIWAKSMKLIKEKVGGASIGLLIEVLKQQAKLALGLA